MITGKQLKEVDRFISRLVKYKTETTDVYYTLAECLERGGGDCEDLALAKYEILLSMGVKDRNMWLMSGRYKGEWHMVLVVELESDWYVMCNIKGVQKYTRYISKYIKYGSNRYLWGLREYNPKWTRYQKALSTTQGK